MAKSPSHQFGQIIGYVLERAIESLLQKFALENDLYLDKKGIKAVRKGKKVSWLDLYGNQHDLDFVLERDGSNNQVGTPVAFIETAWRRYTKHSRNKAQEIQSAILPLVATHQNSAPFIGVILAGNFTDNALNQLKSRGFTVLHFPYDTIIEAFTIARINADFDEQTPDAEFAKKVKIWNTLSVENITQIVNKLLELNAEIIREFIQGLKRAVTRQITLIRILPLHGTTFEWKTIAEGIEFIESYQNQEALPPVVKYEISIIYNTGDRIHGQFTDKQSALEFLHIYQPLILPPAP